MTGNWEKLRRLEDGELLLHERATVVNESYLRVIAQDDRPTVDTSPVLIENTEAVQNTPPTTLSETTPESSEIDSKPQFNDLESQRQAVEAALGDEFVLGA